MSSGMQRSAGESPLRRAMIIVDTSEKLAEALEFIHGQDLLAFDIETTGLNPRKDSIIGFGVSGALDGCYFPVASFNSTLGSLVPSGLALANIQTVLHLLKTKKLLMFNAAFDAVFTNNYFKVDLLPALHADVMLLKHTCDEDFPFGLKEIATKLWGHDVTKEKEAMQASIKANGGAAKEYYKADAALIAAYCVQDSLLTFRVYNHYSSQLRAQGLEAFFYDDEVMPLYKTVTIPMETHGIQLDIWLLKSSQTDIQQDLEDLETKIQTQIAPQLGLFTTWFLNKDYPHKEKGRIAKIMKKYDFSIREAQMHAFICDGAGHMFNLLSKHHLKKLFFDTLKETPLSTTDLGNPQVDEEFIESMVAKYPWCKDLTVYNKLTKLKGTYIDRLLEESEDGVIYPRFFQHRTVSGRYSGDMQQLPRPLAEGSSEPVVRKYTNRIRQFIIPRPGNVLVGADYETLEPSIFAHTSGDPLLQEIFKAGTDFYSEVAIRTERLRDVSSDKTASNYLGRVDKEKRQKAKAYALGIAYGMTGYKLQYEIGVPLEVAESLVADYLAAFPGLARWMEKSKDAVRHDGAIRSEAGRVRHMPRCKTLFAKYGARLGDSLQLWKDFHNNPVLYTEAKVAHKEYKNLCNNAINFQVQSLAASIVNRAAIELVKKLKSEQLKTAIICQVHDELVFEVPQDEISKVMPMIKYVMENIYKLSVPLRAEPKQGSCYADTK